LREQMIAASVEIEVRSRLAKMDQPLKSSQMNAYAKSRYIREHGGEAYLKLPWA
jgi:hypothetical protein